MIFTAILDPYRLEFTVYYNGWKIIYNGFRDYIQMTWYLDWLIPLIKKQILQYKENKK